MAKVAVLGMGAMGSRMAAVLLAAGQDVTVWNRSAEKAQALASLGAKVASTPKSAAAGAEFIISMVRDDQASRQVWLNGKTGALAGMAVDAVAIESSTLTLGWVKELSTVCQAKGTAFIDAPVAGSRPQAEAGKLIYFVGSSTDAFARVEPLLSLMGGAVHYAGAVGHGAAIKLAVNGLFGVQVAAIAELIGFLQGCGLDGAAAMEIIGATPVCSPAVKGAAGAMLAGKFAPLFPIDLVEKDFGYVAGVAEAVGAEAPVVEATRRVLRGAIAQGYGDDNITGLAQLYR